MRIDLKGMTTGELENFISGLGEPSYRARQVAEWLYRHGAAGFEQMTNLSLELKKKLSRESRIGGIELLLETAGRRGDARKYLFRLEDGEAVETVFLKLGNSQSLCLSSQAGCPAGCAFCATGKLGFKRNLTSGEVVDQYLKAAKLLRPPERITNIVFMGMGEPLLNCENLLKAISIFVSREGPAMSPRRITVSTCGIIPGIRLLEKSGIGTELAISLIAAEERVRRQLFPLAEKYPLREVIEAGTRYSQAIKRPVTFEYLLLADINDSKRDAHLIGELIRGVSCKINLVIYNPVEKTGFTASSYARVSEFRRWLLPFCRAVTIRRSKGGEIEAACGQLRAGYPLR